MKIPLFALVAVAAAVAIGTGAVAAQDNETTVDVDVDGLEDDECLEQIDRNTRLCSATIEDGVAVLQLESERRQSITLMDAGAFLSGGEVASRTTTIQEGRDTVRIPVTMTDGYAGVSLNTNEVTYAVPIETTQPLLGGPWTATDAQMAAAGGAASVSVLTLLLLWRRLNGSNAEPEVIA